MTDQVRVWSEELARNPSSLVFLPLGEALRQRGQLDAAERVVVAALHRHHRLADAHDLLAKIYADRYDFERAFDEWDIALQLAPEHAGAHKGLGFLYYRAGELERAIPHLELAVDLAPEDASVGLALRMVRELREEQGGFVAAQPTPSPEPVVSPEASVPEADFDPDQADLVVVDEQGRALAGVLHTADGDVMTDLAAGLLADVGSECERMARLLDLGAWTSLSAETPMRNSHIVRPTTETLMLVTRDRRVPLGRVARHAEQQARAAATWLTQA